MTGVIIGRFQVAKLHLGHIYLIATALQKYDKVVILLGTQPNKDEQNPYSIFDRKCSIYEIFNPERLIISTIADVPGDDEEWSRNVDNKLKGFMFPILLHSRDSFKDFYKGGYPMMEIPELPGYSGTKLRQENKEEINRCYHCGNNMI
jgi:cytidyltransferase-like protein